MNQSCELYAQQVKTAKETLGVLENKLHEIRIRIQKDNKSEDFQELRKITLDMTITLNELEDSEYNLEQCLAQNSEVS